MLENAPFGSNKKVITRMSGNFTIPAGVTSAMILCESPDGSVQVEYPTDLIPGSVVPIVVGNTINHFKTSWNTDIPINLCDHIESEREALGITRHSNIHKDGRIIFKY